MTTPGLLPVLFGLCGLTFDFLWLCLGAIIHPVYVNFGRMCCLCAVWVQRMFAAWLLWLHEQVLRLHLLCNGVAASVDWCVFSPLVRVCACVRAYVRGKQCLRSVMQRLRSRLILHSNMILGCVPKVGYSVAGWQECAEHLLSSQEW
jgi:hypothetical protein